MPNSRRIVSPLPRRLRKSRRFDFACNCALEQLETRRLLSTITWSSATSGNWNVPGNWSGNVVPGSGDDVIINMPGVTVTVNDSEAAQSINLNNGGNQPTLEIAGGQLAISADSEIDGHLTLDGGALSIGGTLSLVGTATWNSNSISGGVLNIRSGASLTLTTSDNQDLHSGIVVNNSGTITDSADNTHAWRLFDAAVINNLSGGVMNLAGAETIQKLGNNTINNESGATFKNTGPGSSTNVPFDNQAGGIVEVDSGTFTLNGGGSSTGGTFNVNGSASVLNIAGSANPTLTGTYGGSGTGTVLLSGGTVTVGAAGATFTFPARLFSWTGGTISNTGGGVLTNTGHITLAGGDNKDLHNTLALDNTGVITDTADASHGWRMFDSTSLVNMPGGIIDIAGAETIQEDGAGVIINHTGAVFENTGTGSSTTALFDNQGGTIEVDSGAYTLANNGASTGGFFNVNGTASVLNITGGQNPIWSGSFTGAGTGTVLLGSGTLNVGAAGVTFNFPAGLFVWSGGAISANKLTNTGFMTLASGDNHDLHGGLDLTNTGTITDIADGTHAWRLFESSVINNRSPGIIDMTGTEMIQQAGGGSINNRAGAMFKYAGTGSSESVLFNNFPGATIEVDTGTFALAGGGASTGGTFVVAEEATLDLTGGTTPVFGGTYSGSGKGTVALSRGTIDIAGGGATFDFPNGLFVWTGGSISGNTLTNTGFITLARGDNHDLRSGLVLDNSGTITDTADATHAWRLFDSSVINNQSGGVINMAGAEMIQQAGGGNINNLASAIFMNTGTGSSTSVPFNNQPGAVIEVDASTFTLAGGGVSTGGTFNINGSGSVLNITGGSSPLWRGSYIGSGTGTVALSSGNLIIGDSGATLNFPAGLFVWSGGVMSGTSGSVVTNTGSITLAGGDNKDFLNGLQLNNTGTVTDTSNSSHA